MGGEGDKEDEEGEGWRKNLITSGGLVGLTSDSSKRSSDQTLSEPGRGGAGPLYGRGSLATNNQGGQSDSLLP